MELDALSSNHTFSPRAKKGSELMKIVVIGGTGLIGSKLVQKLTEHRHEAIAVLS